MNRARILLIGSNGQVGWELQRCLATLGDIVAVDRPQVELSHPDSIRALFRHASPAVVVNAAAYTAVDKAENEPELATKINAVAPGVMAEESKRLGAAFFTYSTDYVFDGTKPEPYNESDQPNPISVYGRSKSEGDAAVQQVGGTYFIFRTSWVYGARGKNFLLTMTKLARERESLSVVNDQVGAPTWSRFIAESTAHVISKGIGETASRGERLADYAGLYNLACSGVTSWYGFTEWIVGNLKARGEERLAELTPIFSHQYPCAAKRPHNSVLNCDKLERNFGIRLPDWRVSAGYVMEELFSIDKSLLP
jgi:dTDP-4-dehydrorhamnose reductase